MSSYKTLTEIIRLSRIIFVSAMSVAFLYSPLAADVGPYHAVYDLKTLPLSYFTGRLSQPLSQITAGNPDKALAALKGSQPSSAKRGESKGLLLQALALQALGKDEKAMPLLIQFLSDHPANSDAKYFLAVSQARTGKLSDAASSLEDALWFARSEIVSTEIMQLELANVYRLSGDTEHAKKLLDTLSSQPGSSASTFLSLASIALEQGERDLAIAHSRKALELQPTSNAARLGLAQGLLLKANKKIRTNDAEEAKKICGEVIATPGVTPSEEREASFLKLSSLIELEQLDDALALHKKLSKKYSSDPQVQHFSKQLEIELARKAQRETVEAVKTPTTPVEEQA